MPNNECMHASIYVTLRAEKNNQEENHKQVTSPALVFNL